MFDFIIHILFVSSLGFIVYLIARALPRVADDGSPLSGGVFDRLVDRLPLQRLDQALLDVLERILRKAKMLVTKMDNSVNAHLARIRANSPAVKNAAVNLKEKMEAMMEDDGKK
jgi:hypothetical protein